MNQMNKIILIKRYQPTSFAWPNLERKKKISTLSVQEILNKYQGFSGELVAIYYVKDNDPDLKDIYKLFLETPNLNDYIMLYVVSNSKITLEPSIPIKLVGYDVGRCEEDSIFSSVTSEILFGGVDELVTFKDILNEYFLFPDKESAENYVKIHKLMSVQGKDVEDYMPLIIYEIWKFKTS